jgi:23S rRNA G2445 N2-methylase RlmL
VRYFATTVPGLGSLLADEAGGGEREFDGRADVVVLEAPGNAPPLGLRLAEDVFVEVGHGRAGPVRELAAALLDSEGLERALSVYGGVRPLRASMTFRVIARVRSERDFQRTAFREELAATVAAAKPRWRGADPADIELWALETRRGGYRLGLRLTTGEHRHRGGRAEERVAALRPAVAAGMVRLAGPPATAPLLDPCCGSGTVLTEATAAGWRVVGGDVDPGAIGAAIRNTSAPLVLADAARSPLGPGAAGAVVTNLPFGQRYRLPERPVRWFSALLAEVERVTYSGAPLVFLVPELSGWRVALDRHARPMRARVDIKLLGMDTTIWLL